MATGDPNNDPRVMGWGTIIALMVATGLCVGVMLGLIGEALALSPGRTTAGVGASIGASIGVMGSILIARRRDALAQDRPRA